MKLLKTNEIAKANYEAKIDTQRLEAVKTKRMQLTKQTTKLSYGFIVTELARVVPRDAKALARRLLKTIRQMKRRTKTNQDSPLCLVVTV